MELDRGQAELFGDLCVLDLACLIQGFAHYEFSHVRRRSDGGSAAERLELCVFDDTIFVNTDLEFHHIPASVQLGAR